MIGRLTLLQLAERGILPYDWDRQWGLPSDSKGYSLTPDEVLGTKESGTRGGETLVVDDDNTEL